MGLLKTEALHPDRELHILQVLLESNERCALLQKGLDRLTASLAGEVRGRQAAEERVRTLEREKEDLEILVQILTDQGDDAAEEGSKARIDGLTQIANRRRFDEYLVEEWRRHALAQYPLALLLCDIDQFKLYNDSKGHQAGDECLKRVAKAISNGIRPGDLVARYGGEEFVVILPYTDLVGAVQIAARIRMALAAADLAHSPASVWSRITMSIGAACRQPQAGEINGPRALVADADRNLYIAKQNGRNRIEASETKENER